MLLSAFGLTPPFCNMISIKKRDPLPSVFLFASYSIYKTLPQVIEQSLHLFFMKKIHTTKGVFLECWVQGIDECGYPEFNLL